MNMPPVKTYEISVRGFDPQLYCARSPAKARAQCWRDFTSAYDVSFKDFLASRPRILRVDNPPGVGDRILVSGKPATRVLSRDQYVHFMRDDSDQILCSHPLDVEPAP